MRKISSELILSAVEDLCRKAAFNLPSDVYSALKTAAEVENRLAKSIILDCIKNADIAASNNSPICQDTGLAVIFVELGDRVLIEGEEHLFEAIQKGVRSGYEKHYLRKSVVGEPLFERKNTGDNTPAIIHLDLVKGDGLKIILAPKGGGTENCSALKMLKPSDGEQGVVDFVVNSVVSVGGNPCPPVIVGVGIGGTAEKCMLAAKKALLREIKTENTHTQSKYRDLEKKILELINKSNVGPQGLGGKTTALSVHIETLPTHIACLPVAVAVNCHVARHAEVTL